MNKPKQKDQRDKNHSKISILSDKFLMAILIGITFLSGVVICIRSKIYINDLRQNKNYPHPTMFNTIINTAILTFIMLIPKVLVEKALIPLTEKVLDPKFFTPDFKPLKSAAQRSMSIAFVKLIHYTSLTIHSYFVYNQLPFFPKELFGHGNMIDLYAKDLETFSFFDRPKFFDLHYLINLAYTFVDLICVTFIYERKKDLLEMIFHHFCTISLLVFSYFNHFDGIGAMILFLHNMSDILVYLSRTLLNVVFPKLLFPLRYVITGMLLLTFVYCRLFVYGKIIYHFFLKTNWESYGIIGCFKFLLCSLYILHCSWTYKLLKIVYKAVFTGELADYRDATKKDLKLKENKKDK